MIHIFKVNNVQMLQKNINILNHTIEILKFGNQLTKPHYSHRYYLHQNQLHLINDRDLEHGSGLR